MGGKQHLPRIYHKCFLNNDFAKDPEVRLLAQAALDYYISSYALKYRDGILSGPSQRGFSKLSPVPSPIPLGWMWWGTTRQLAEDQLKNYRYTSHTAGPLTGAPMKFSVI